MSPDRFLKTIAVALLSSLLLPGPRAWGDEFRFTPSLGAKDEYNNNIFFTSRNRIDSYILTVSPRLEVSERTERLNALLDAGVDRLFYTTDSELDTWDQRYRGALGYRISERFRFSTDVSWRREGRPDRDIEETGLLVGSRSDRLTGSATFVFPLGMKAEGGLSYGYDKIDYQSQSNVNSEQHTVGLGFSHDLGQHFSNTKARANLGYSRSRFTAADVANYTMTVGFSREVHELWSVLADVGARYTRSELDVLRLVEVAPGLFTIEPGTETSSNTGWVAKVALAYKGEKTTGNLSFYEDVAVAGGRGGAAERTALTLDLARRGSYEFTGFFSAGYYWNRSEAGQFFGPAIDERTVRVRPRLRYAATKNIDVEAAYQYTRVLNQQTDTSASQNIVYLRVALRYPVVD
jgi:hypothetical protein